MFFDILRCTVHWGFFLLSRYCEECGDNFLFHHRSQESAGIKKRLIKFLFCLKREVSSHNESAAVFLLSEAFASRPGD